MIKRLAALLAVTGALLAPAAPASADPNGAPSKPCAPGQHAGSGQLPEPGFKPPACDPDHGAR